MRIHRDRSVKFDAFKEKEWNWWRPKGTSNKGMGHTSVTRLMINGQLTSAGKRELSK